MEMNWLVTLKMNCGPEVTLKVSATNKSDAEYRAAYKAETQNPGRFVDCTIAARKSA